MFTVPIGRWFCGKLKGMSEELLLGEQSRERGLFATDELARMLSCHQAGTHNYTREIRALMALEIWFREVFDPLGEREACDE